MKNISVYISSAILISLVFFGGYAVGDISSDSVNVRLSEDANENVDLSSFWKVWDLLDQKYIPASSTKVVSDDERVFGAISGMVDALDDPYTVFFEPVENEAFQEIITGNFSGVGMEVSMEENLITVIAPLKDTPAEQAGMQPGDIIVEIDDVSTRGLSLDDAIDLIRGEVGTEVVLSVMREGAEDLIEISIVRDVINIPTIDTEIIDDVFVISLYNFSASSYIDFREALREFAQSGVNDLILDLRGNPGGFLEAAVDIASWFLPTGKTIVQEQFGDEEIKMLRSKGYDVFNDDLDMVILVNKGSASASEIVAGALQEYDIATLVGVNTFGKGSVQELVDVTSDTSLKVTIARWLTPQGKSISDGGLTPDIIIDEAPEGVELIEYQLQEAVRIVKEM